MLDEIAAGEFAALARRCVSPFRSAFPDFEMEIVDLIAEDGRIVAHFRCSGTHLGEWLGVPATGCRFENVDELYIFGVRDGRLVSALGVEDNLTRLLQLDITPRLDCQLPQRLGLVQGRLSGPPAGGAGAPPPRPVSSR